MDIMGAKFNTNARGEPEILSENDIREALLQYAESFCCYGRNPARKMNLLKISTFQVYRYHSDVFIETRELKWQSIPFHKPSYIDGPENGTKPLLWEMLVDPPNGDFKNAQIAFEVPHTTTVSNCEDCQGSGYVPCEYCCNDTEHGANNNIGNSDFSRKRENQCNWCSGVGYITEHLGEGRTKQHKCTNCGGKCITCLGKGKLPCTRCHCSGLLKSFQQLEIKWRNKAEWNVVLKPGQANGLRPKHLATATGEELVYESHGFNPDYNLMDTFPDPGVRESSARTYTSLSSMVKNNSNFRILKVKQTVVTIMVAEVDAVWNDQIEKFFVYGKDKRVHFPNDYPENCCRFFKFQCYLT